jgi:hypothetical protein
VSARPVRSIGVLAPGRPALLDDDERDPGPGQAWVTTETLAAATLDLLRFDER